MGKITPCKDIYESRLQYNDYINNHIKTVQEVYDRSEHAFKTVFPEVYKDPVKVRDLYENIKNHDKSKRSYNEFWPYALKFFPPEEIDEDYKNIFEKFQNSFDIAWLHHAHSNPHHPAYWVLAKSNDNIKIHKMQDIYIIEMLCDWMAMAKYFNNTTLEYWKSESAQKLPMHEYTRAKVEEFMEWMYKYNVHTLW